MQLESVLSGTTERSISAICDFYKSDINKEQLHSQIQQFLTSIDLNVTLKMLFWNCLWKTEL